MQPNNSGTNNTQWPLYVGVALYEQVASTLTNVQNASLGPSIKSMTELAPLRKKQFSDALVAKLGMKPGRPPICLNGSPSVPHSRPCSFR